MSRHRLGSLEARVDVIVVATQAPTDILWEAVFESVTSEIETTAEEWVNE